MHLFNTTRGLKADVPCLHHVSCSDHHMMSSHMLSSLGLLLLTVAVFSLDGYDFLFNSNPDVPRALLFKPDRSRFSEIPANVFTMCFFVFIEKANVHSTTMVSYSSKKTEKDNEVYLEASYYDSPHTSLSTLHIRDEKVIFDKVPTLNNWTHICTSWESSSGIARLFMNGMEVNGNPKELKKGYSIRGDGYLIIGNDQEGYNSGFQPKEGVKGRMTQFNLWDTVLTEEEVNQAMNCELKGTVSDWPSSQWGLYGNIQIDTTTAPCGGRCGQGEVTEKGEEATTQEATTKEPTCTTVFESLTSPYDLETDFQDEFPHSIMATLKDVDIPDMRALTLCFVFSIGVSDYGMNPLALRYVDGNGDTLISFGYENAPSMGLTISLGSYKIHQKTQNQKLAVGLCLAWSGETGEVVFYLYGQMSGGMQNVSKGYVMPGNGRIIIHQEQDSPLNKSKPFEGFRQKLVDLFLWDRQLSNTEVQSFNQCHEYAPVPIFDSSKSKWTVEDLGCPELSTTTYFDEQLRNNPSEIVITGITNLQRRPSLNQFSICFHFYIKRSDVELAIFKTKTTELISYKDSTFKLTVLGHSKVFTGNFVRERTWQHFCITWKSDGIAQLYVDGNMESTITIENEGLEFLVDEFMYSIRLTGPTVASDPTMNFDVKSTMWNVWDHVLMQEEVSKVGTCSLLLGNVASWKNDSWTMYCRTDDDCVGCQYPQPFGRCTYNTCQCKKDKNSD